jgi:hypothetical protein
MTTVNAYLAPTMTFKSWLSTGIPNAFGTVTTYQAGTTTPIATWTDWTATTPNSNPATLNARGEMNLYLLPNTGYKIVEADSNGNQIKSTDQVFNSQLLTLYGGVDSGVVNAYIVSYTANVTALANGIIVFFTAANSNTGASTLSVSFNNGSSYTTPAPIVTQTGSPLSANVIVANEICGVVYNNGNWVLFSSPAQVPTSGSFTGTLTGFASPPAITFKWYRSGNKVTLINQNAVTGTSTTNAMSITGLPAGIQPATVFANYFVQVIDSGTIQLGTADVSAGSASIVLSLGAAGGVFTASGTKGLPTSMTINYDMS